MNESLEIIMKIIGTEMDEFNYWSKMVAACEQLNNPNVCYEPAKHTKRVVKSILLRTAKGVIKFEMVKEDGVEFEKAVAIEC